MSSCYHCGLPADSRYSFVLNGENQLFCCISCQSVAQAISQGGLVDFYQYRDAKNSKAESTVERFEAYDQADVQRSFVTQLDDGRVESRLSISGISCAACAWLIEQRLKKFSAVKDIAVNATNYRCRIVWSAEKLKLSEILSAFAEIGFQTHPYLESERSQVRNALAKKMLMRLGVAGLGMMQVGMFAIALHAGALQGMDAFWQNFFRFVSLLIATPVVLYSAQPFFKNAWRSIVQRHLVMDVPVALAIGLAYVASFVATFTQTGDVYFESISMFTFFLLLGRYLEMRVRHSSAYSIESLSQLLPVSVERLVDDSAELVPMQSVERGDSLVVSAGSVIPVDGVVVTGASTVDESVLTGESRPLTKSCGDTVFAGTSNGESRLVIEVKGIGGETQLAAIERLVEQAYMEKPRLVALADRLASGFVCAVLISACVVGLVWYWLAPERTIWVMLSVLVATCPCALSLATPAALTAGISKMRRIGLFISSSQFMEKFSKIDHVVFDKTGTLTSGHLEISTIKLLGEIDESEVLEIIAALETHSRHPIAEAFNHIVTSKTAENVSVIQGKGLEGNVGCARYRFGKPNFSAASDLMTYPGDGMWQLLTKDSSPLAWVLLEDAPRKNIDAVVAYFKDNGITCEILSGDRMENVTTLEKRLGIAAKANLMPEQKLEHIRKLQSKNKSVLMVGDGINDVPVLSGADVSVAMGEATQLAQIHADAVLSNSDLGMLVKGHQLSLKIKTKIRQNLLWALLYNGSILPLAAMGLVAPYVAAIGMSLSSLLVVLNALRVRVV